MLHNHEKIYAITLDFFQNLLRSIYIIIPVEWWDFSNFWEALKVFQLIFSRVFSLTQQVHL